MSRPLAIIWDIENCKIPKSTSATDVVIQLRKYISNSYPKTEFCRHFYSTFACDSVINVKDEERKMALKTVESLNVSGVNVLTVNNIRESAADAMLIDQIRLYAKCHKSAVIVFITTDMDFSHVIKEVKENGHTVIVIHREKPITEEMKDVIKNYVDKSGIFDEIIGNADDESYDESCSLSQHLIIENISPDVSRDTIITQLTTVSNSVLHDIVLQGDASKDTITFACLKDAKRAKMIMNGMTVFGRNITATIVENEEYGEMISETDVYMSPYVYDDLIYTKRLPVIQKINWNVMPKTMQFKRKSQFTIELNSNEKFGKMSHLNSQSLASSSIVLPQKSHHLSFKKLDMSRPLAIIWDNENCEIPKNTSATDVVIQLRKHISNVFPKTEFCHHFYSTFACDSVINAYNDNRKIPLKTVESLIISGVKLLTVNNIRESAADEILIDMTRLFAKCHDSAVVVFITSDADFCDVIKEVKSKGHTVMVIYKQNSIGGEMKSVIKNYVDKSGIFDEIIENAADDISDDSCSLSQHLIITNITSNVSRDTIKRQLTKISNTVLHNIETKGDDSKDTITFACLKDAERAERTMNRMIVFGRHITATLVKNENYEFMISLTNEYMSPYIYDDLKYTKRMPMIKRINWVILKKASHLKRKLQRSIKSNLNKKPKEMRALNSPSASSSNVFTKNDPSIARECISLKCGVTLTRPDYYTIPTIEQINSLYDPITDKCVIDSLTVGRHNYGSIYWDGPFDIKGLNLDEIIHIKRKEVIVYPDDDSKPEVGESLNRPAQITLHHAWPIDKTTHEVIKDFGKLRSMKYAEKVESATLRLNAQFKEYRTDTGSWVFDVKHFSKYGMTEDDEEMEDANDTTQSERIVESKELSDESKVIGSVNDGPKETGNDTIKNIPLKSSSGSSLNPTKDVRNSYDASHSTSQLSPPNLYSLQPMNVLSHDLYRNPYMMSHVLPSYSQSHLYPMVVFGFRNFLSLYDINVHELSFAAFYALLMRNHFSFENTMSELMMIVPRYDNGHLSRVPFPDHHSKY